jgi:hypothetical protein
MYSEQLTGDVSVDIRHDGHASTCHHSHTVLIFSIRCPSNVSSNYRALEQDIALWYSPWTREHGTMRILDPAYIPDALVHQRAVFFDFWRGVLSWRGESTDTLDSTHPYDFAIKFR